MVTDEGPAKQRGTLNADCPMHIPYQKYKTLLFLLFKWLSLMGGGQKKELCLIYTT